MKGNRRKNLDVSHLAPMFVSSTGGQMAHTVLPQAINKPELSRPSRIASQRTVDLPSLKERFRTKASQSHLEPEEADSPSAHHYASLRNAYGLLKEWITLKGPITHTQMNPSPVHPNIPGEINMTLKPKSKWRLGLPNRKLKTGEYLFYSGQISCGDLPEAVAGKTTSIKSRAPSRWKWVTRKRKIVLWSYKTKRKASPITPLPFDWASCLPRNETGCCLNNNAGSNPLVNILWRKIFCLRKPLGVHW